MQHIQRKYPEGGNMSNEKTKQYTHLNIRDRAVIAYALDNKASFASIAKTLGKNKSTIAREVKLRYTVKRANLFNNDVKNICAKRKSCNIEALCKTCDNSQQTTCSRCKKCNSVCPEFDPVCEKLKKAPFVCNGCNSLQSCQMQKHIYDSENADKMYEIHLSNSRRDPAFGSDFVKRIDMLLTKHLQSGKSIYNFLLTEQKHNSVSPSTIYRWAKNDYFSIKADDMPSLKPKPSKDYSYPKPKPKHILAKRTYADYLDRMQSNEPFETVQMDTVLGKRGSKKVILTMCFTKTKLLLAFLLDRRNVDSVKNTIEYINQLLAPIAKSFFDLVPVLLLDNGSEFSEPLVFEMDDEGEMRSSVYYCDAYTATQRAQIERAHVELRKFLPKGSSFDDLTQAQLDLILSHLNSYKLASLNGKSPLETFNFAYGENVSKALNLQTISDRDVVRNTASIMKLLPDC